MISPWFRSYLAVTLLGLDLAENTCRFWMDVYWISAGAGLGHSRERWLSTVEPDRAHWARAPLVYNCAAAAYAVDATDLSRLNVANSGRWRAGSRCGEGR